ncbi:T9SS type A sorting domain-containing protein [Hymenobacter sp. ASUV-10]|uniref:T9SS type A sorting domain-containing protein n=1 Tax=Hymenobacter aranciens TaxID=3063996 RepID=A0ABT9B540_9BACT|nr:T9SS type A sorting domain-containing protein [Hymenobacter sp. ASUV-10]MDO7873364.1 T9SS type A sorting domain-containing protein [Hymenobacter sp. ASUV-10]
MPRPFTVVHAAVLLLLMGLLATPAARAQAPAWGAVSTIDNAPARIYASATDAAGNVFVTGAFSGVARLGSITLTSSGDSDIFVAKWSPATGRYVWAQRAGGVGLDDARAIAVAGNAVYVTGIYRDAATFGTTQLPGSINNNAFVCKLVDAGTSGSFSWAHWMGGTGNRVTLAEALAVVGTSVYVGGRFSNAIITFSGLALQNANEGNYDGFVAKLTDAGATASFTWAERLGGPDDDRVRALAVAGNALYVAGAFDGAMRGGIFPTLVGPLNNTEGFVGKLTDQGPRATSEWERSLGGSGVDEVTALTTQGVAVYLTGYYTSPSLDAFPFTLRNSSSPSSNLLVVRLQEAGGSPIFTWVQSSAGTGDELGHAIAVRGNSVYVAGSFDGSATTWGASTLVTAGQRDVLVMRLTEAPGQAAFDWAVAAGGSGSDSPATLALSGTQVLVAGSVASPAAFGSTSVIGASAGAPVGFLASLTDLTLGTRPATAAALTIYPNPAHARTTVPLPALVTASPARLTLLDALGRAVRTETVALAASATRHALDLAGLAPGLYLVRLTANGTTATQRLVVE